MAHKKILILTILTFLIVLSGCNSKQGGDNVSESKEESKQTVSLEKVEGVWEGSINVPN